MICLEPIEPPQKYSGDADPMVLADWLRQHALGQHVSYLVRATTQDPMTLVLENGLCLSVDYFVQPCGETDSVWYLQLHPDLLLDLLRPMVLREISCAPYDLLKVKFTAQSAWVVAKLNTERSAGMASEALLEESPNPWTLI